MMVDGAEEGQLKGPIDVLAPYTWRDRTPPPVRPPWMVLSLPESIGLR